jgi:hypothetical protein
LIHLRPAYLALMLVLLLAACVPPRQADEPSPLPPEAFAVGGQPSVAIEANAGLVRVVAGPEGLVEVEGRTRFPERTELHTSQSDDTVSIVLYLRGAMPRGPAIPPAELEVRVPPGATVRVETFVADVELHSLGGVVQVASTAGRVMAHDLEGSARLSSTRSDVSASGGQGDIRLLGEHGVLSFDGVRGILSASTIMGTIRYAGAPGAGDSIRLETDHGPVEVRLDPTASLDVQVASNSGRVICPLAGLSQGATTCAGRLGEGEGSLTIRTVSGNVDVRRAP